MFLLNRGPQAFVEFDEKGKFIRVFGEGLFKRAHGLRIDNDGNIWVTDVDAHVVMKLNPARQGSSHTGTKGEAGRVE